MVKSTQGSPLNVVPGFVLTRATFLSLLLRYPDYVTVQPEALLEQLLTEVSTETICEAYETRGGWGVQAIDWLSLASQ